MTDGEFTKTSGRRTVLAAIGCIPAGIALLIVMPLLGWMLVAWLMFQVPNGSIAVYDGFEVKSGRGSAYRLMVSSPLPTNFFVLIKEEAVPIDEVTTDHLLSVGFKPDPMHVNGYERGTGIGMSFAQFNRSGKLLSLRINEYVPVFFSSSKDGPWLKLPVDFDEVKQQFGKPNDWRYTYPARWG